MPAKKRSVRKKPLKKPGKRPCKPKDICEYLETLDEWLKNEFWPSYQALRNAVCNLDRVAIRKLANQPAAMLCPGTGGGHEPPVITPPPSW